MAAFAALPGPVETLSGIARNFLAGFGATFPSTVNKTAGGAADELELLLELLELFLFSL